MTLRSGSIVLLAVFALLLQGCPAGPSALIGVWTMTHFGTDKGLELKANGDAVSFMIPPDNTTLTGALTWEATGSEFTMRQSFDDQSYIYVGRITGNNSISGRWLAWEGPFAGMEGTWSAVKQ